MVYLSWLVGTIVVVLFISWGMNSTRKAHKTNEALAVSQERYRSEEAYQHMLNGGKRR